MLFLTFRSSVVMVGGAVGGAANGFGLATVTGGAFRNNSVIVAGSGQALGGGLHANANIEINGTLFEFNAAYASNNIVNGALYKLVIFYRLMQTRSPTVDSSFSGIAFGGATNGNVEVAVSNSIFFGNSAVVAGIGQAQGGAVYSNTAVQATDSRFGCNIVAASNTGQNGIAASCLT